MALINYSAPARSPLNAPTFNLVSLVSDWNDVRRTRKALSRLTLRELDDIGLVPGDIERIAKRRY